MKGKQNTSTAEPISFAPTKKPNKIGRNDKATTLKMLKLFVTAAKKCNRKMRSCIKENNWVELKAIAQKHIPTYCAMGLNEFADFLKYIDDNALDVNKQTFIEELIKLLYKQNSETIDAVQKYIGLILLENTTPVTPNESNYSYVT